MKFYERRLNLVVLMRSALLFMLLLSIEVHNVEMKTQAYYRESKVELYNFS